MKKNEILKAIKSNEWFCFGEYEGFDFKEFYNEIKAKYKYFVTAKDLFLTGWGEAKNKSSYQVIFCTDNVELSKVLQNIKNRNDFSCINWNYTSNKQALYNYKNKYITTFRNDFKD